MSCLMGSHGVFLATAMAVSGTVILLLLCRQRPMSPAVSATAQLSAVDEVTGIPPTSSLRPCISDSKKSERKAKQRRRQKKKVQFAEQVVELRGEDCNVEEDKQEDDLVEEVTPVEAPVIRRGWSECTHQVRGGMPANRVALYSGILRDRHHRMACSY